MAQIITSFEQGSLDWYAEKLGMFSGSDFHIMLGESKTKEAFMYKKLGERLFGDYDMEETQSQAMERGSLLEPEARRLYCAANEVDVLTCGVVKPDEGSEFRDYALCSPDGLVGDDGIIEIKCPLARNYLQWVEKDFYIKPQYKTQVQFNLFITERNWCDFIYYHPRAGMKILRIERNEEYIDNIVTALREGVKFLKAYENDSI